MLILYMYNKKTRNIINILILSTGKVFLLDIILIKFHINQRWQGSLMFDSEGLRESNFLLTVILLL